MASVWAHVMSPCGEARVAHRPAPEHRPARGRHKVGRSAPQQAHEAAADPRWLGGCIRGYIRPHTGAQAGVGGCIAPVSAPATASTPTAPTAKAISMAAGLLFFKACVRLPNPSGQVGGGQGGGREAGLGSGGCRRGGWGGVCWLLWRGGLVGGGRS